MDEIGVFIATLHGLLGHAKTAAYLGQDPGSMAERMTECKLCIYEHDPSPENKRDVEQALAWHTANTCVAVLGGADGRTRCELPPHGPHMQHVSTQPDGQRRTWSNNESDWQGGI